MRTTGNPCWSASSLPPFTLGVGFAALAVILGGVALVKTAEPPDNLFRRSHRFASARPSLSGLGSVSRRAVGQRRGVWIPVAANCPHGRSAIDKEVGVVPPLPKLACIRGKGFRGGGGRGWPRSRVDPATPG